MSALSNCLYWMHEIFFSWLFQKWSPQKWGWAGSSAPPVPLGPLFHLSPSSPHLLPLSMAYFFGCSPLLSPFSPVKVKPLLNATVLHSRGWAGIVPVRSDSWCWKVTWVTAEPNPAPAPLDWRGLPHLERGGPEPLGAPSLENTPLICCEQGIMDIPQRQGEKCWRFLWCLPETQTANWSTLGESSVGIFSVFLPPSCGANCASGNSRSWECSGWAGAMVCF